MAGYHNYSKSNNAIDAEENGRMTATQFAKWLRKLGWKGVTSKFVKDCISSSEWHHTSKMYNTTDYYDPFDFFEDRKRYKEMYKNWKNEKSKPKPKVKKEIYFKCWNFRKADPRKWEWKLTNRDGNHLYKLDIVLSEIEDHKKMLDRNPKPNKTDIRIKNETYLVFDDIINTIKNI